MEEAEQILVFYQSNKWMKKNTNTFLEFLLRAINLKNAELFSKLEGTFPLTLKRDPEFKQVDYSC